MKKKGRISEKSKDFRRRRRRPGPGGGGRVPRDTWVGHSPNTRNREKCQKRGFHQNKHNTLKLLKFSKAGLQTVVADMEQLPFENELFDVVTYAGSLSYGDAKKVDSEIHRVIKPSGFFICVDSLNNNPVYRLNRFIHYLKKERTKKTLLNMPTYQRIVSLRSRYKDADVNYFGSISFITQLLSKILGPNYTSLFSDYVDKTIKAKKSAFKFVLIAKV